MLVIQFQNCLRGVLAIIAAITLSSCSGGGNGREYSGTNSSGSQSQNPSSGNNSGPNNNLDHQSPTISLNLPAISYVEAGASSTTQPSNEDVSALDDSGVSPQVAFEIFRFGIPTSSIDSDFIATYLIRYTATDEAGNSAFVERAVIVSDTMAPWIALRSGVPLVQNLNAGTLISQPSIANDIDYGDAFSSSITTAMSVSLNGVGVSLIDTSIVGAYTITYSATDSSGNRGTISRTINIATATDTTPPVITLNVPSNSRIQAGTSNPPQPILADVAATDNNGTPTVVIRVQRAGVTVPAIVTTLLATYVVRYTATDSAGNSAFVERTVVVSDEWPPQVDLAPGVPAILNVNFGAIVAPPSFADIVYSDGFATVLTPSISITNDNAAPDGIIDTSIGGSYYITYSVADPSGNIGSRTRTIYVGYDVTPPVIILNVPAISHLEAGSYNTEQPSAQNISVTDNSGIVLPNIDIRIQRAGVTVPSLVPNILGVNIIRYTAYDQAGNSAWIERTVTVSDTTPPTVTLANGVPATLNLNQGDAVIQPTIANIVYSDSYAAHNTLTASLVIIRNGLTVPIVDSSVAGTYIVNYSVSDPSGNIGTISRTITIASAGGPICPDSISYRFVPVSTPTNPTTDQFIFDSIHMNNQGMVVANVTTSTQAASYLWNSRTNQIVENFWTWSGGPQTGVDFRPYLINDAGALTGLLVNNDLVGRQSIGYRAAGGIVENIDFYAAGEFWQDAGHPTLPRAINNAGMLAGNVDPQFSAAGFATRDRSIENIIPAPPDSKTYVTAMNDSGIVVGYFLSETTGNRTAFEYNSAQPGFPPAILTAPNLAGYESVIASDINEQNQVILSAIDYEYNLPNRYFLWQNGSAQELELDSFYQYISINNLSHIAGTGWANGNYRAVVIKNGTTYNLEAQLDVHPNLLNFMIYQANQINDVGEIIVKYAYNPSPSQSMNYRYAVLQPICP